MLTFSELAYLNLAIATFSATALMTVAFAGCFKKKNSPAGPNGAAPPPPAGDAGAVQNKSKMGAPDAGKAGAPVTDGKKDEVKPAESGDKKDEKKEEKKEGEEKKDDAAGGDEKKEESKAGVVEGEKKSEKKEESKIGEPKEGDEEKKE